MRRHLVSALAMAVAAAGTTPVFAADISGAMTADFLVQCSRNQDMCRDFANDVLRVLNAAASFGQARDYKGCAPFPLSLEDTGKLVAQMLARPQEMSGYAADDIGKAAQAVWPCR